MAAGNFEKALETLEESIAEIQRTKTINRSLIKLVCSSGGLTNIDATSMRSGLCNWLPGDKRADDPDQIRINFRRVLQGVFNSRHNGSVVFEIKAKNSRVYDSSVVAMAYTADGGTDFCMDFGVKIGNC